MFSCRALRCRRMCGSSTRSKPRSTDADIVLSVMPSHAVRDVYTRMLPWLQPVHADSQRDQGPGIRHPAAGLAGDPRRRRTRIPDRGSFRPDLRARGRAVEIRRLWSLPPKTRGWSQEVQASFSGPTFRAYGSCDPAGVEIGGALKNVIAIGAGISDGLGLGHNAVAALITRGLAELTRLAVAVGARAETMSGLAGSGRSGADLYGRSQPQPAGRAETGGRAGTGRILDSTPMVAEGVTTTSVSLATCRAPRC